jgi:hypothetical protein
MATDCATAVASSFFLLVAAAAAAYCSSMDRLEVLLGMVGKTVEDRDGGGGGWRRTLGLSQRWAKVKKIDGSDYHIREKCAGES